MKQVLKIPLYNKFYYDFLAQDKKVLKYLPGLDKINWQEECDKIKDISGIHKDIKKVLIEQNKDLTSPPAQENLNKLANTNSTIIFTGQQLGILASPLYTVYKAITTIKLANTLNKQRSKCYFIPVFWLETNDHDFQEVNRLGIWDKNLTPLTLMYNGKERSKTSIHHYRLEKVIINLLSDLHRNLIDTEFTDQLFTIIQSIYKEGTDWLDSTRNFLKFLFQDFGLLYFNPADVKVKKLSLRFYVKYLENIEQIRTEFSDVSSALLKDGYKNQIKNIAGKTFIHIENEALQREHLYYKDKKFYREKLGRKFTLKEIKDFICNNPESFSPGVVSRPLLQSWLLPTVAYVAGPAEITYWAQLKNLFDKMEIKMPVIFPRISATIIEPKIARFIRNHKINLEDINLRYNDIIKTYYRSFLKLPYSKRFVYLKSVIEKEFKKINQMFDQLDPTLQPVSVKAYNRIINQIENLENKTIHALELKEKTVTGHLKQIYNAIFPYNQPQERFISICYFLNKFGIELIPGLINELKIDEFNHQIVGL